MAANTIITSIVTGGSNSHTTTAEEANVIATDFVTNGVVGAITLNTGSGGTGSFCVNQNTGSDMAIIIKAGQAYITATPSSQNSQILRARASADYTAYTINANASGSTKFDWIYLSVSATNANTPAADGSNVTSIVTSRSSSSSTDNGTPPTYGLLLAVVTVANGATAITNANVSDKRYNTSIGAQNGSLIVSQASTGVDAKIAAAGIDANVNIQFVPKGTGNINGVVDHLKNPYKFRVHRTAALNSPSNATGIVAYDTKEFDTGTNIDVVTNKGRFTAPIAGFYWFNGSVELSSSLTGTFILLIYKNGVQAGRCIDYRNSSANKGGSISDFLQLAANDYVEVALFTDVAVAFDVTSTAQNTFSGFLVSAT